MKHILTVLLLMVFPTLYVGAIGQSGQIINGGTGSSNAFTPANLQANTILTRSAGGFQMTYQAIDQVPSNAVWLSPTNYPAFEGLVEAVYAVNVLGGHAYKYMDNGNGEGAWDTNNITGFGSMALGAPQFEDASSDNFADMYAWIAPSNMQVVFFNFAAYAPGQVIQPFFHIYEMPTNSVSDPSTHYKGLNLLTVLHAAGLFLGSAGIVTSATNHGSGGANGGLLITATGVTNTIGMDIWLRCNITNGNSVTNVGPLLAVGETNSQPVTEQAFFETNAGPATYFLSLVQFGGSLRWPANSVDTNSIKWGAMQ